METPPADAPTLTVWLDTENDDDQVHVRLSEGDTVYETVDTDLEMLLRNEQFLRQIQQSGLNLISLYQQALADEIEAEGGDREDDETVDELVA
jgi:hypothetical protein